MATLNLQIKKGILFFLKLLLGIVLIAGNNSSCLCACRVVMYETWGTNLADKQCRVGLRNWQSWQALRVCVCVCMCVCVRACAWCMCVCALDFHVVNQKQKKGKKGKKRSM